MEILTFTNMNFKITLRLIYFPFFHYLQKSFLAVSGVNWATNTSQLAWTFPDGASSYVQKGVFVLKIVQRLVIALRFHRVIIDMVTRNDVRPRIPSMRRHLERRRAFAGKEAGYRRTIISQEMYSQVLCKLNKQLHKYTQHRDILFLHS